MFDAADIINRLSAPVRRLASDSRLIEVGDTFLAYPGYQQDGRDYIGAALSAGATSVLWEAEGFTWNTTWSIPHRPVVNLRYAVGHLANEVYGKPSYQLPVTAVTGTNGKTTISHFMAQLLAANHQSTGLIGTLGIGYLAQLLAIPNTTPDAIFLHEKLRQFVDEQASAVVIEASSHGIHQGRLNGLHLTVAMIANVGRDHLDYHGDIAHYQASKAALLAWPDLQTAILNADDDFCQSLASSLASDVSVWTFGRQGHTLQLLDAQPRMTGGFSVELEGIGGRWQCHLNVAGIHNVENFLAAALGALALGVDKETIIGASPTLTLPSGRLQKIHTAPDVYVDFAHTPDALATVLQAMQPSAGRLIVVFGCGGDRDKGKRYQMGEIAGQWADTVVITDDNPRTEVAADIRHDIQRALPTAINIADRKEAMAAALSVATTTDTVLILGKGHETYQEIDGHRYPFSDIENIRALSEVLGCE